MAGKNVECLRHLLFMCALLIFGNVLASTKEISDMGRAREYCDSAPLERIEGIWRFPADDTVVLIRRDRGRKTKGYELIVVSSPDCRLSPGDRIGEITAGPDPSKMKLSLCRSKRDGIFFDPGNCAIQFNDKEGTIKIEKRTLKLRISSTIYRLLPQFWRLVSMVKTDDPQEKLPDGLVRIYPAQYSSKSDYPRYL
ncbi:MAG: hypothetical protein K2J70_00930 [Muribaculaceae bacterium]|nr:hypothetical protein [Muribaculaceae bacterium]